MTETIAILDGDILAYVNAAATEERSVAVLHKPSGRRKSFKNKTEFRKFLDDKDGKWKEEDFELLDVQSPEDVSHTNFLIKKAIGDILQKCKTNKYEVYLSGKNNFRDNLPLPTKYKSNRQDMQRPVNLQAAKDYLIEQHGAIVVDGFEADDKLSMRAFEGFKTKQKIIQVSTDKDACGCNGWLFNPQKMQEPVFINGLGDLIIDEKNKVRGFGRKWLYFQWLVGDVTDGYKPTELCKVRFGEKRAYKLLLDLNTDEECWKVVYDQYLSWYPEPFQYTDWEGNVAESDSIHMMQLYLDCCRMLRWEGDKVQAKDVLTKMGITDG